MDKKTYIVKHKDYKTRLRSRSGGFFFALASMYLQNNGVVYGCAQNEQFEAEHIRIDKKSDLPRLAGSKYVQSDLKDTFHQVEEDLKNGANVLYSGTGCQIEGLIGYLHIKKIDTRCLLTIDIVCHGAPSPEIWRAFLQWAQVRFGGKITAVDFRDKTYGWSSHFETLTINNKKHTMDYYKEMFYKHYILRPSCYHCPYCDTDRVADLTIADAWGVDYSNADFNDDKGCSLVIVNSEHGKLAFNLVEKLLDIRAVDLVHFMQPNLKKPSSCPKDRFVFWQDYANHGFEYVAQKYGGMNLKGNLKRMGKMFLGKYGLTRKVKRILKK